MKRIANEAVTIPVNEINSNVSKRIKNHSCKKNHNNNSAMFPN
jgi:hypothetical protein